LTDPDHFVGWEMKTVGNLPAQGKRVLMTNQFGVQQAFQLTGVGLIKMPAHKQPDVNGPPPPPVGATTLDIMMCYSAKGAPNTPGGNPFVPKNGVTGRDKFS